MSQKGSLTFPSNGSNALARLQQLRAQVDTPAIEATDEASFDETSAAPQQSGHETSPAHVLAASNEASKMKAKEAGKEVSELQKVRERIETQSNVNKEPTSRLNVELRDSLHTRLKRYCAHHKVPIRLVVDALIEEFLRREE